MMDSNSANGFIKTFISKEGLSLNNKYLLEKMSNRFHAPRQSCLHPVDMSATVGSSIGMKSSMISAAQRKMIYKMFIF